MCRAECLLAYGVNVSAACQRSAVSIDKILQGAKPTALPVERPDTMSVVINDKTAEARGLALSPVLLSQAAEVIR